MTIQDPEAVWIMQGWMFSYGDFWHQPQIEAILSSVPSGRMIILDLDSTHNEQYTRTKSYYHLQPFIFNDLSNFGGGLGLFGRFENINRRPFEARNMQNSTMIGKYYRLSKYLQLVCTRNHEVKFQLHSRCNSLKIDRMHAI